MKMPAILIPSATVPKRGGGKKKKVVWLKLPEYLYDLHMVFS